MLDRCPTRNRLISWGLQTDGGCLLCYRALESRDHILFSCDFSAEIWRLLRRKLNIFSQSDSWLDSVEALISLSGQTHSIFEIWRERNNRLHRNIFRTPSALITSIGLTIRNTISSIRDNNFEFSRAMQFWLSLELSSSVLKLMTFHLGHFWAFGLSSSQGSDQCH